MGERFTRLIDIWKATDSEARAAEEVVSRAYEAVLRHQHSGPDEAQKQRASALRALADRQLAEALAHLSTIGQ